MYLSIQTVIACAQELQEDFAARIKNVAYEEKGVLFSEMLFLFAAGMHYKPRQILESGRARAQSTLILSLCFPDSRVISIERYSDSADAAIAAARLVNQRNVCILFGDARRLLPYLLLPGDIVLIDGPKRFSALRLAFTLLSTSKPKAVFVHDCYQGLPERHFLDIHVPEAFSSDHSAFANAFRDLDDPCWQAIREKGGTGWNPYEFEGKSQISYGPTLMCIPFNPTRSYLKLLWKLRVAKLLARFAVR